MVYYNSEAQESRYMLEMRGIADLDAKILDGILEPIYELKLNYTINALYWRSTFQLWSSSL
jgi:hypothetical protein